MLLFLEPLLNMQIHFPKSNLRHSHTSSYLCDNTAYILLHPSSDPVQYVNKSFLWHSCINNHPICRLAGMCTQHLFKTRFGLAPKDRPTGTVTPRPRPHVTESIALGEMLLFVQSQLTVRNRALSVRFVGFSSPFSGFLAASLVPPASPLPPHTLTHRNTLTCS